MSSENSLLPRVWELERSLASAVRVNEALRQQLAKTQEDLHFQACLTREFMPYQERAVKAEQQLAATLAACQKEK